VGCSVLILGGTLLFLVVVARLARPLRNTIGPTDCMKNRNYRSTLRHPFLMDWAGEHLFLLSVTTQSVFARMNRSLSLLVPRGSVGLGVYASIQNPFLRQDSQ